MTPDELKSIPKGQLCGHRKRGRILCRQSCALFLDLAHFPVRHIAPEHASRPVTYASRQELIPPHRPAYGKKGTQPTQVQQAPVAERRSPYSAMGLYNEDNEDMSYFGSIYADQELSHRAKTVYMYLKDRSNADGTCWPSVRRIAEDLKLSRAALCSGH